jgi:hypothetical protein
LPSRLAEVWLVTCRCRVWLTALTLEWVRTVRWFSAHDLGKPLTEHNPASFSSCGHRNVIARHLDKAFGVGARWLAKLPKLCPDLEAFQVLFVRDLALLEGDPARVLYRVRQVSNELRLLSSRRILGLLLWPFCLLLLHLSALSSHLRSPLPQSLPLQAPSLLLPSQSCLLWLHRLLLSLASHVLALSSLRLYGLLLDCVGRHLNQSIIKRGNKLTLRVFLG